MTECGLSLFEQVLLSFGVVGFVVSFGTALIWWKTRD